MGDALCGQLLCHGALLRSGSVCGESAARAIGEIMEIAGKRSYLVLPAYKFAVAQVEEEVQYVCT